MRIDPVSKQRPANRLTLDLDSPLSPADSTGAGAPRVLLLKPANEWAIERETARGNTAGAPVYRNGGSRSFIGGATEMRTNDLRWLPTAENVREGAMFQRKPNWRPVHGIFRRTSKPDHLKGGRSDFSPVRQL